MARGGPRKIELEPDMWLTQFGEHPPGEPCRNHLRSEIGETHMSLILGQVDTVAASAMMIKRVSPLAYVRHVTVGALRDTGFTVEHSPTKFTPLHVSVHAPKDVDGLQREWDDDVEALFKSCFDAAVGDGGRVTDDH